MRAEEHIAAVDVIKALAILAVVVRHRSSHTQVAGYCRTHGDNSLAPPARRCGPGRSRAVFESSDAYYIPDR